MQTFCNRACHSALPLRVLNYNFNHVVRSSLLAKSTNSSLIYTPNQLSSYVNSIQCAFHSSTQLRMQEDKGTKSLAIWSNVKEVKASPRPALTLALCGLVPFIVAPMMMISSAVYMPAIAAGQLSYGACVLAFTGGVRWGFVLPDQSPAESNWVNFNYSVAPPLIAFTGLLMPVPLGLLTLIGGLGFTAYADMTMYGYPKWYKGIRFVLSFVGILSLWSTYICYFVLDKTIPKTTPKTIPAVETKEKVGSLNQDLK